MKKSTNYYLRKSHRYLGLFIGIQLFFWTLGGLFFTWSDMAQIRSEVYKAPSPNFSASTDWVAPQKVVQEIEKNTTVDSVGSIIHDHILGKEIYRIRYFTQDEGKTTVKTQLAYHDGQLRGNISEEEAKKMALAAFAPKTDIEKIEYLEEGSVNHHHEYRGRPLPAWKVHMQHKSGTRVYISAVEGRIETFRNSNWRIFDFFWMMHTMDYQSRDHIGNWMLRAFSILSMVTILSGFIWYLRTSRTFKKLFKRKKS